MDITGVRAYVQFGKVDSATLLRLFDAVREDLIRYPAIDPEDYERRLGEFLRGLDDA